MAAVAAVLAVAPAAFAGREDDEPPSSPAAMHPEADQAAKLIRAPAGFKVDIWAKEPLLRNPVALTFDERGRAYVVETFRRGNDGAFDIDSRLKWIRPELRKNLSPAELARLSERILDRDLASRTLEDRLAFIGDFIDRAVVTRNGERIEVLEDRDGDGVAEAHKVFADGWKDALDGIAASAVVRRGEVFLTNIPHLWLLSDRNGDAVADARRPLHRGFGVRYASRGHDLHGARIGPDKRLYFSVGDRGARVVAQGRTLDVPDAGSVFRCDLDGGNLEVFATGLRNPHDLTFDDRGHLFTGDNNADGGDGARWVYVVEGSDSGWRIGYQYLAGLGPWNAEGMWRKAFRDQPAFLVPPVENISNGPAGVAYYPGTGLPASYAEHFFLADFKGQHTMSGVWSFTLRPRGAAFELRNPEKAIWGVLVTDVEFGSDGGLYLLDWVQGWERPGKGRIYRVYDPKAAREAIVLETKRLMAEGMSRRSVAELAGLLGHADRRVRQEAQFELADRGATGPLLEAARAGKGLARLHGIWGAGLVLRQASGSAAAARGTLEAALVGLLDDADPDVRGQAAVMLGDARVASAARPLAARLSDESAHVQLLAGVALSKLGGPDLLPDLLAFARRNGDRDPYLRHAAALALASIGARDPAALLAAADGADPAVRRAVLLALRRLGRGDVQRFLSDTDPSLVREAARAINDVPIDAAMPALAALPVRASDAAAGLRVVNANFRLGTAEAARRLGALSIRPELTPAVRTEAIAALGDWRAPPGRDRVIGIWRPVDTKKRELDAADAVVTQAMPAVLRAGPDAVRTAGLEAARRLRLGGVSTQVAEAASSRSLSPAVRALALGVLADIDAAAVAGAAERLASDPAAVVRVAALRVRVERAPREATPLVDRAMTKGTIVEKQAALASLRLLPDKDAEALLARWLDQLVAGQIPPETRLDLLEAAAARAAPALKEKLAAYEGRRGSDELARFTEVLAGGDAQRGSSIFRGKAEVACQRCHAIGGLGGDVGPKLDGVGRRRDRRYLLESIVAPSRQFAPGFESIIVTLRDGSIHGGTVKKETATSIELLSPENARDLVKRADVKTRERGASGMPDGFGDILTKRELRDLIEYLASLR